MLRSVQTSQQKLHKKDASKSTFYVLQEHESSIFHTCRTSNQHTEEFQSGLDLNEKKTEKLDKAENAREEN